MTDTASDTTPTPVEAFHVPSIRSLVRHGLPALLIGTVMPIAAFLAGWRVGGESTGIVTSTLAVYAALAFRHRRGDRLEGTLIVGAVMVTLRAIVSLWSGQTWVYFAQPAMSAAFAAILLPASAVVGVPLTVRIALDFLPLPASWQDTAWFRRTFDRVTWLWSAVLLANALGSAWLLVSEDLARFVVVRSIGSTALGVVALAISVAIIFRGAMREGARITFADRGSPSAA